MFSSSSTEFFIDILDTLGFGFLILGALCSFVTAFWWSGKIKWIFASLSFFVSAANFFALAWFSQGFAWDVVPLAVIDILFVALCLRAGVKSS